MMRPVCHPNSGRAPTTLGVHLAFWAHFELFSAARARCPSAPRRSEKVLGGLPRRQFTNHEHHMVGLLTVKPWAFFLFYEFQKPVTARAETPLNFDSLTATDHHRPVRSRVIPCVLPALKSQFNCLPDQDCLLNCSLVCSPHGAQGELMRQGQCSNEAPCHANGKSSVFEQVPCSETSRAVSVNLLCVPQTTHV